MIHRLLLIIGFLCLGLYAAFTVQAWWHQKELEHEFERLTYQPSPAVAKPTTVRFLNEGDLVGRLEIPRLSLSVMVMEGIEDRTLRLGAGRIPGTALPWDNGNIGIAAHRDSFFRPLSDIRNNDVIRFTTVEGTNEYRVTKTSIVEPEAVDVLKPTAKDTLTLVTCYPFYWVGPAPKRFIVQATKD